MLISTVYFLKRQMVSWNLRFAGNSGEVARITDFYNWVSTVLETPDGVSEPKHLFRRLILITLNSRQGSAG